MLSFAPISSLPLSALPDSNFSSYSVTASGRCVLGASAVVVFSPATTIYTFTAYGVARLGSSATVVFSPSTFTYLASGGCRVGSGSDVSLRFAVVAYGGIGASGGGNTLLTLWNASVVPLIASGTASVSYSLATSASGRGSFGSSALVAVRFGPGAAGGARFGSGADASMILIDQFDMTGILEAFGSSLGGVELLAGDTMTGILS